jgi:hypothetical protein
MEQCHFVYRTASETLITYSGLLTRHSRLWDGDAVDLILKHIRFILLHIFLQTMTSITYAQNAIDKDTFH